MSEEHYFLALWPDPACASAIERLTRSCWAPLQQARPVAPANYHLTLAFLGSLPPHALGPVTDRVGTLRCTGFTLVLDRLGWFATQRVLYFAPSVTRPGLTELHARLVTTLTDAGFPPHPPASRGPVSFRPHVTLARGVRDWTESRSAPTLTWRADRFCLARSHPGRDYEILAEWPLCGLEDGPEYGIIRE